MVEVFVVSFAFAIALLVACLLPSGAGGAGQRSRR